MKASKLLKDYPSVLKEWDYELNPDVLMPEFLSAQSNKQYYWKCGKGHPSYLCSVGKKTVRKFGCPVCSNHKIIAGINDFESHHPELMEEWNWEVNDKNGVIPSKLGPTSSHMVSWKCKKCGNTWDAPIANRVRLHSACPYCANLKVQKGYNDLETTNPEIAKQWDYEKNNGKLPSDFVAGTDRKAWFKCEKGHSWKTSIRDRVLGRGCPICSRHKVLRGFNDFETTCPEAAKQWDYDKNGNNMPYEYTSGSETRAWFKCEKGHSWRTRIAERGSGQGCPYCSNKRILKGFNDLATVNPSVASEWNYDKNEGLLPSDVMAGSNKKVWWKCRKCGNEWQAIVSSRSVGRGCPKCGAESSRYNRLKAFAAKNGLTDNYPDLMKEWDYIKNKDVDLSLIFSASNKKVWWICPKGHSYYTRIVSRTQHDVGCPYCHNQKVIKGENDLDTINPSLAKEWDYEKNYPLTPRDVFAHTPKKYWWKCDICGNSWQASVNNRSNYRGCPNCSLAGTSFIEQALFYFIKKYFYDAKSRHKVRGVEYDIFIPSRRIAIEYDGSYYHSIRNSEIRERKKDLFSKQNNITLIRLREEPLPNTYAALNMSVNCKSWGGLEKTIKKLLSLLGVRPVLHVSIKENYVSIITSKKQLIKENSIATLYEQLVEEWDYEKNKPLLPEYFTRGSDVIVWWKCKTCGHEWKTAISNRTNGTNCPACAKNRRIKKKAPL